MARTQVELFMDFVASVEAGDVTHICTNAEATLHKIMICYDELLSKTSDLECAATAFIKCYSGYRLDDEDVVEEIKDRDNGLFGVLTFSSMKEAGWSNDIKELQNIPEVVKSLASYVNTFLDVHKDDLHLSDAEERAVNRVSIIAEGIEDIVEKGKKYDATILDMSKACAASEFVNDCDDEEAFESEVSEAVDDFYYETDRSCHADIRNTMKNQIKGMGGIMGRDGVTDRSLETEYLDMLTRGFGIDHEASKNIYDIAFGERVDEKEFDEAFQEYFTKIYMTGVRDDSSVCEYWLNNVLRTTDVRSSNGLFRTSTLLMDILETINQLLGNAITPSEYESIIRVLLIEALGFDYDLITRMKFTLGDGKATISFNDHKLDVQFSEELRRYTSIEVRILTAHYINVMSEEFEEENER